MDFQPVETIRPQRLALREDQQRPREVVAHVVEVRRQRIDSAAEVYVVREEDDVVPKGVGNREAVEGVAPQRKAFLEYKVAFQVTRAPFQELPKRRMPRLTPLTLWPIQSVAFLKSI